MSDENIFLFVPNLIGYVRIGLAIVSLYYMPFAPYIAVVCYLTSGLLDAFDGHAARLLNQGTRFGALLDMLTDRCATMCLCVVLSMFYPTYAILFQLAMTLDIASHWLFMVSTMMKGSTSHKAIDLSGNPILNIYYTSRPVLFFMCAGNEIFFSMLYMLHFFEGPMLVGNIGLFKTLLVLSTPIALAKAAISALHLVVGAKNIGYIDVAERKQKRELEEKKQ